MIISGDRFVNWSEVLFGEDLVSMDVGFELKSRPSIFPSVLLVGRGMRKRRRMGLMDAKWLVSSKKDLP